MCHSNLNITFNKMVTCISGRNGSGKSAVMIALGILFGQRAKSLERGNSYKSLIKTGSNQAIIRVVLNNTLAYKIERYGDTITIEKKLRENLSKTSIYNSLGKIFNVGKDEIENIANKYGLKLENPLNFLTQERSKRFLSSSSPEDLYDFYYVGTEFKSIEAHLTESMEILEEMNRKLKEAMEKKGSIEAELLIQNKKLQFLQFDAESELKKLEIEAQWNNVNRSRKKSEELKKEVEELNMQIFDKEEERKKASHVSNTAFVEESTKEVEEKITKLKLMLHDISNELEEYKQEREQLVIQIERIKSKSSTTSIESALEGLEKELTIKKEQVVNLESRQREALKCYEEEKEENQAKEQKRYALKKQVEYLKQNVVDQSKRGDIDNFKRIEVEISKLKFKDTVIGPVCSFIKLKESKWYRVASIVLKKTLTNFIVFNTSDKLQLHGLFKALNVSYSISQVHSKKPYENLKTNGDFKTLLSVLQISNPLVSNQLITLNNIEQIILIEEREKAHSIIKKGPMNVDCAYTATGDRIKQVHGSLSDFRQKDDGIYWFEEKEARINKIIAEISSIEIKESSKGLYNGILKELRGLTEEIGRYEIEIKKHRIELEALSSLKENNTEGIEKKLRVAEKSIYSLEKKRKEVEEQLMNNEKRQVEIIKKNRQEKQESEKRIEEASFIVKRIDGDIMILENKKHIKISERRGLRDSIDKGIKELGEEPERVRSSEQIEIDRKRIIKFKIEAKEMEKKEKVEERISGMNKELKHLEKVKEKFESTIKETLEVCKRRAEKRDEIKGKNTEEAIRLFKEYTMRNGYIGEMTVDHENRRLNLRMKVHNSNIFGTKNTLSGGERSFAGICFLLSMWKCFRCPLKVLDEFDVFMDSLNRGMAIRILFEFFKENRMQVILITPLDTRDLSDENCDVKVMNRNWSE
ncbi:Structural maintenance of chromosomes protein 6 [Glugoides intestinalis]